MDLPHQSSIGPSAHPSLPDRFASAEQQRGLRRFARLALFALAMVSSAAWAVPTSVVVCKRVISNGDGNNAEGGAFTLGINAAGGGSLGDVTVNALESAAAATCAAAVPVPAGRSNLQINEAATRPAGWTDDAPGFPTWTISGPGFTTISGNGTSATLPPASFTAATGVVTVTFNNQKGRRVELCKRMYDNGQAPASDGVSNLLIRMSQGAVLTNYTDPNWGIEPTVDAEPGIAGVSKLNCQATPFILGAGTFNVLEGFSSAQSSAGFPRYILSQTSDGSVVGSAPLVDGGANTSATVAAGGVGNLRLIIENQPFANRTLRLCTQLENSPGVSGAFTLYRQTGPASMNSVNNTVADGQTQCSVVTVPNIATQKIGEILVPATFGAFQVGYPKWEMYVDDGLNATSGTPLAAATNEGAGAFNAASTGEWLNLDWAQAPGVTAIKVVIVNASAPYPANFGNGADSTTGELLRICKTVEDNGSDIGPTGPEGGSWSISVSADPIQVVNLALTGAMIEGNQTCVGSALTPSFITMMTLREQQKTAAPPGGWPGYAAGYPFLRRTPAGGSSVDGAPFAPTNAGGPNTWGETVLPPVWSSPGTDMLLDFRNRAADARTLQVCTQLLDNGLAPTLQQLSWSGANAIEGAAAVCISPTQVPAVASPAEAFRYTLTMANGAGIPLNPGWALDSPTLLVTGSGGGSRNYSFAQLRAAGCSAGATNPTQSGPATACIFNSNNVVYSTIPDSAFTDAALTGNLTATWVATSGQSLLVCKRVLANGDAIDNSGTFRMTGTNLGIPATNAIAYSGDVVASEGGSTICKTENVGVWGISDTPGTYSANEQLPGTWPGSSPGYPRWELRYGSLTGPLQASGSGNATPTLTRPTGTPASTGDLYLTFINRTGPDRFVRICKQLNDNTDGVDQSGSFGFGGSVGSGSIAPFNIAATEGTAVNMASGLQCSGQFNLTALDGAASSMDITETLPAGWPGSAAGYPQWQVFDAALTAVAGVSGSGSSASVPLANVTTPNFYLVFSNRADAAPPTIAKSFAPATIAVNGTSTVTLTLTNSSATNPAVLTSAFTDNLPTGVTYIAGSAATSCGGGTVSGTSGSVSLATGASIPAGGSCTVTFTVTSAVPNNVAPCHQNVLPIGALQTGLGSNAAAASASLCVSTPANITLTKSGPATSSANGTLGYTIALGNSGQTASGTTVTVSDVLPAGVTYVGALPGPGVTAVACTGAPALVCTVTLAAALPAGAPNGTASFLIHATAPATAGSITNYASVDPSGGTTPPAAGAGCTPATSCGSATTLITTPAIVSLTKTGTASTLINGAISYTLTVSNSGGSPTAANLIVQDLVPAGEVVTAASGASCAGLPFSGDGVAVMTCTIAAPIAGGANAVFTLTATAPSTTGTITNYASTNTDGSGAPPPSPPGANCRATTPAGTVDQVMDWDVQPGAATLANFPQSFAFGSRTLAYSYVGSLSPSLLNAVAFNAALYPPNALGNGKVLRADNLGLVTGGSTPYEVTLSFTAPVHNLRFTLFDLDGSLRGSITAADAGGVGQAVTLDPLLTGPVFLRLDPGTNGTPTPIFTGASGGRGVTSTLELQRAGVNVTVPGTVKTLVLRVWSANGGDGTAYFSDLTFNEPAGNSSCASAPTVVQAAPVLTLVKEVVNDNGGTATTANFPLSATGPTSISGVSGSPAVTNASVTAGSYTLGETNVAGYTAGAWSCSAGTLTGNTLVLANDQNATCTIVNNDQPATLTLVKTVTNDNGGVATVSSFPLTATGPTTITGLSGTAAVTVAAVSAGTYALSEANVAGYTAGAWSCSGGTLTGSSLALTSGQSATCTINNNDQPATLTLVKTVTNDNGGTATVSSFPLTATGPTTITGVSGTAAVTAAAVSAGSYALSETNLAGYTAGAWSCVGGTLTGSSLALTSGQSATCTINNNDQSATLTLIKTVTNDNGGTATVSSFTLTATGPTTITGVSGTAAVTAAAVSAGSYALSETNLAGYTAGAWSCVGGTLTGSSLALTSGQSATCTINNNDQGATLTLVKAVTNDNGGIATVTDFPLTATGPTPITGVSGTPAVTAANVSAGSYVLSEVNVAGYTAGAWSCVGGSLTGSTLTLANNQSATCTINNNDQAATLTLVKTVTNDNGGTATISSFPLTATGPTTITGVSGTASVTAAAVSAGTYALSEVNVAGYVAGAWSCVGGTLTGSSLALTSGQSATCTINNNDIAPNVTLVKALTSESGTQTGIAEPGETLTYTITLSNSTATAFAGYDLVENVPVGATLTSVTGTGVTACATPVVGAGTCAISIASVPGSSSVTVTVVFTVANPIPAGVTQIANTVSGGDTTCDVAGNTCTVTTPVAAILSVSKAVSAESITSDGVAQPGEAITYTITVRNQGGTAASNVLVNERVPANTTFVSGTPSWTCAAGAVAGTACNALVNVPAASGATPGVTTLTFVIRVADPIPVGVTSIANVVALNDQTPIDCTANPTAPACVVLPTINVSLAKTVVSVTPTGPNTYVAVYQIDVVNTGGSLASYTLTDTLGFASGVSFIGAATVTTIGGTLNPALAGGTYTPVNGTVQQLSAGPTFLAVGASHRYTVNLPIAVNAASVSAGACTGTAGNGLFNQANLSGSFTLGSNACAPVSGDVVRIALAKTVQLQTDANHNGYGDVGDVLGYRFVISNPGSVTLSAIQLIDPRVSTLSCAPVTANGDALTVLRSDTISSLPFEALGSLAAGDSLTCTASYSLTAEDVANHRVVNTATTFGSAPSGQVASATSTAIFAQFR